MVPSIGSPFFDFRRYFLSQMSAEAGCMGMPWAASGAVSLGRTASRRTMLIVFRLSVLPARSPDPTTWGLSLPCTQHVVYRPENQTTPRFRDCQPPVTSPQRSTKSWPDKDLRLAQAA